MRRKLSVRGRRPQREEMFVWSEVSVGLAARCDVPTRRAALAPPSSWNDPSLRQKQRKRSSEALLTPGEFFMTSILTFWAAVLFIKASLNPTQLHSHCCYLSSRSEDQVVERLETVHRDSATTWQVFSSFSNASRSRIWSRLIPKSKRLLFFSNSIKTHQLVLEPSC